MGESASILKKQLRPGSGNNNGVAAGSVVRAGGGSVVRGSGQRKSGGGQHIALSQAYDGQKYASPPLNNAKPVSKTLTNAAAEYTRDPATSTAQRQLMAIAEHHPNQVYSRNKGVLKMSKGQLHDFAATKGLKH